MNNTIQWREVWEATSRESVPDFELDRGMSPRDPETEALSEREHVNFIDPSEYDVVLDAGCGTGSNMLRLHSQVREIIGIDYAYGSIDRCRKRIQAQQIHNARVCVASLTSIPLPDCVVSLILCFSVLQYLNDEEVRCALKEFVRVLRPGGIIILHVKNSSSLYWSTLRIAKQMKMFLKLTTRTYYLRPFRWYVNELEHVNCRVLDYRSFNLLTCDCMPSRLVTALQRFEFRRYAGLLLRTTFVRRHGADLKIKAVLHHDPIY